MPKLDGILGGWFLPHAGRWVALYWLIALLLRERLHEHRQRAEDQQSEDHEREPRGATPANCLLRRLLRPGE
jgi:hypothetical protein